MGIGSAPGNFTINSSIYLTIYFSQLQIYLSEVLDWHAELNAQEKWDDKAYSPTRNKLLSALESISGYNPEALLKRLPADALYEERALLLGKMNQHELALSLYVHKVFCIKDQSACSFFFMHTNNVILCS